MKTKNSLFKLGLMATSAGAALFGAAAMAQGVEPLAVSEAPEIAEEGDTVPVTGPRIRRSQTDLPAPVTVVNADFFADRGLVSAAGALNQITSINPALNLAPGDGSSSGSGQQFPSLFGLGEGRTLTLVNGRRFVTTSSGLGDAQVDANVIPVGLIDRIEVVQAGGAAVYGSDAIAGVVNYILKDDFEGLELDVIGTFGDDTEFDEGAVRATWGMNFADGRGNIAINAEYAKTEPLQFTDRPFTNLGRVTAANPADTGPNDGIPSVQEVLDARFWEFNENGLLFFPPAPFPTAIASVGGGPVQFGEGGTLIPYDTGTVFGIPFASGGDGYRFADLASLRTGVERLSINAISHYDIADNVRLSGEFLYANTEGVEQPTPYSRTVLNPSGSGAGALTIIAGNPFLPPQTLGALVSADPAFGFGRPFFLSKIFPDARNSNDQINETDTYRAALSLDGDFAFADRDFYWSVSGSYGRVEGSLRNWQIDRVKFDAAAFPIQAGPTIQCLVNIDGDPTNDDPDCVPLNPFGPNSITDEVRDYINVRAGNDYTNEQIDILATFGGSIIDLPAGPLDFSVAYEHRREEAEFVPLEANQLGLFGTGTPELPQSGEYNTNEFSLEVLVPILRGDFALPLVRDLEFSGAYRYVDNSIAGEENVYNLGLRWEVFDGLTLRGSQSRNFRAPTLTQLLAPQSVTLSAIGIDPCDADRIDGGPNPAARRANCEALFAANPQFGDLATFQDPAENFQVASVTSGGNPDLRNEVSDTTTYGVVFEPNFIPGLTITADRIEIDLEDGLSAFETQDFAATCFDNAPQPAEACAAFTRLAMTDGTNPAGTIVTGRTTTFNAGVIQYEGEVYNVTYDIPLDGRIAGIRGDLTLAAEATHTSLLTTSVTGDTFTRTDGTAEQPDWVTRYNFIYTVDDFRANWQIQNLSEVDAAPDATIENNPNPRLDSNTVHSISIQQGLGDVLTLRAGVTNLFDKEPSYPNFAYGDIFGRRIFVGLNARF